MIPVAAAGRLRAGLASLISGDSEGKQHLHNGEARRKLYNAGELARSHALQRFS